MRAVHADGDETPTVTPYRPTVSNPADLSAPGWLELEAGAVDTRAPDHARVDAAPWLLKYAFDEDYGLLIGGNLYTGVATPASRARAGFGDSFIEWKQRFAVREGTAFGIEAGFESPTAPRDIGIGKPAWMVNLIFSTDLGAWHLDLNAGGTRYSRYSARSSPWQSNWAAAISHAFGERCGGALEVSGSAQRGADHGHQMLAAINYNLSRRIVLDAGGTYALDRAAHDRGLFAGGTFLLGRLR